MKTYLAAASSLALTLGLASAALATEQQGQSAQSQAQEPATGQSTTATSGSGMAATQSKTSESAQTGTKTAGDLDGMAVVNDAGDEIGEVEKIVGEKGGENLSAVVSVGGFLGIGDKEVAIPLSELSLQKDKLVAAQASSKKELEGRAAYNEDMYEEVPEDQDVNLGSEGSTMEQGQMQQGQSRTGAKTEGKQSMGDEGKGSAPSY